MKRCWKSTVPTNNGSNLKNFWLPVSVFHTAISIGLFCKLSWLFFKIPPRSSLQQPYLPISLLFPLCTATSFQENSVLFVPSLGMSCPAFVMPREGLEPARTTVQLPLTHVCTAGSRAEAKHSFYHGQFSPLSPHQNWIVLPLGIWEKWEKTAASILALGWGCLPTALLHRSCNAASFLFLPPEKENQRNIFLPHLHWAPQDVGRGRTSFEATCRSHEATCCMTVIFLLGSDRGARNGDWVTTFPLLILGCFHLWGLIEKKVLKTKAISPRVLAHKSSCPFCASPPSRSRTERRWGWSSTESILLAHGEKITVQELDLFLQLKWMQLCLSIALWSDQDGRVGPDGWGGGIACKLQMKMF